MSDFCNIQSTMSSWFLSISTMFLAFLLFNLNVSESTKNKHPSVIIVGTVYCDTCFQDVFARPTNFIAGALVAVECGGKDKTETFFRQEVETDEHGEFKVQLPLSIGKHLKRIKGCSVNLVRSSDPYCAVASTATSSSSIRLKSRKKQGTHIFSAGFFTFKPLKQPTLCSQKPTTDDIFPSKFDTNFPPPIQDLPPTSTLTPILGPILPDLPPLLSNLPPLPFLPPLEETSKVMNQVPTEKKVQGNTNTNTLLDFINPSPQIPLLPPSTPSLFPSNPFQPSTHPLINISPLIPGLIPGIIPSSSPPPAFSIPSFQPSPGFPGIPQSSSSTKKTSSP